MNNELEHIDKALAAYHQQQTQLLNNLHALSGAIQALEALKKALITPEPPPQGASEAS